MSDDRTPVDDEPNASARRPAPDGQSRRPFAAVRLQPRGRPGATAEPCTWPARPATGADGSLPGETLVEQFDQALANVVAALAGAGGAPEHLVRVHIYVTDAADYRDRLRALGDAWRRHLGAHYPAVALFEVAGLFDPAARVELVGTAVVPGA